MPGDRPNPPWVVCRSEGGPYDDEPFLAGYELGALDASLASRRHGVLGIILRADSLPQVDLIAMRHGYTLTVHPRSDLPGLTYCVLTRVFTADGP